MAALAVRRAFLAPRASALAAPRSRAQLFVVPASRFSTSSTAVGVVKTVQSSPYAQTHTSADIINFGIGQPSPSLLPLELFQKATQHRFQDGQDNALFQYGTGKGYEGFRQDLAAFLSGIQTDPIDPDALLITAGNSQAISHAAMAFSRHNKRVFVEEPTYFLSHDIFHELGLELAPLPVDEHGLDVDALEKRLEAGDIPAFIYTIPFFQNPTGTVLSEARRKRLVALADKFGFYVISDEPYNLLTLDLKTKPYASLASYDTSGRVVSLGSFSKILAPGLRLVLTVFFKSASYGMAGWAQSSKETIQALSSLGTIRSGGGQNPITAGIVHSVLQLNLLAPHIETLQRVFMSRKVTLCSALRELCPECAFVEPAGGYFVWVQLPDGVDADLLFAEASTHHGVAFTPGSRCSLGPQAAAAPSTRDGLAVEVEETEAAQAPVAAMMSRFVRLSFAFYSDDEIRVGFVWSRGTASSVTGGGAGRGTRRVMVMAAQRNFEELSSLTWKKSGTTACSDRNLPPAADTGREKAEAAHQAAAYCDFIQIMSNKSKNPMVATTAGAIAGGIETFVIWPMEMIKTNLQLGTMRNNYTGMISGFRYHIRQDGFLSLYRGLAPVLIGSIPKAGIRFGAFDFLKQRFADENGQTTAMRNLAAGMVAGAMEATIMTTPIETLKTKLIGANAGVWQGTKMILAKEGIAGIYQGLTATILKQSSNQGLRFMFFSEFKKRVNPEVLERYHLIKDAKTMSSGQHATVSLVGGMSAGIFSVFGNNPFDVVKTRMQGLHASQYKNTLDCVRQMIQKEGFLVFYSGIVPRLGRVIPGQGVIFMSYDGITRVVARYLDQPSRQRLY
ncbi:Tricarboxylate transporter, partial [Globisporangium splendens]